MPVCFRINPGIFSMLFVKHTYTGVTPELRIELNYSTLSASADSLYNNVHECYLQYSLQGVLKHRYYQQMVNCTYHLFTTSIRVNLINHAKVFDEILCCIFFFLS